MFSGSTSAACGHCRVDLSVDQTEAAWGEEVRGALVLTGGRRRQKLAVPTLGLYQTMANVELSGSDHSRSLISVAPEEVRRIPFCFRVPATGVPFGDTAFVMAAVVAPWRVPASVRQGIMILPVRSFLQIAAAVSEVTGLVVRHWGLVSNGDGAVAMLVPREDDPERRFRVRLELYHRPGLAYGELGVEPLPKSPLQIAGSVVGLERKRVPVRFDEQDLPNAAALLTERLRPHVDDLRNLPIPAATPAADADVLPRPAAAPDDVRP